MGILKSIGDFLFGKDPQIFDDSGNVRHCFPDEKWNKWSDRFRANPEYDWRDHTGQHLGKVRGPRVEASPKKNKIESKH